MKAAEEVLGREISFTKFWTLMLNWNVNKLCLQNFSTLQKVLIEVEIVGILALTILQKLN
jgi:hypothetical protein